MERPEKLQQAGKRPAVPCPEITAKELLPLITVGEAFLEAFEEYSTLRSLSPNKAIWADMSVGQRLKDSNEAVVREFRNLGRGAKYNEYTDGPYAYTPEVFDAVDCFWAATCGPGLEDWRKGWLKAGSPLPELERRIVNLRKTLGLLKRAARPAERRARAGDEQEPTPRKVLLKGGRWDESRDNVKLTGWKEILQAIGVENSRSNQRKIRRYQKGRGGPIGRVGRTSMADHGALVAWWSRIEQLGTSDGNAWRNKGMAVEDFVKQDKSVHKEKRPNAKGRVR